MSTYKFSNRYVKVIEVKVEIGEGAQALEARYVDTDGELNEQELEQFNSRYSDEMYADAYADYTDREYERFRDAWLYGAI